MVSGQHSGTVRPGAAEVVPRAKAPLALLAALTALGFCALHMVIAILPVLADAFAATPGGVQPVVSLYLAGIAVGQLVYGPVSDRFGRRPVLLAGLAMFLAGTALCAAAGSLAMLVAGRVLQASGGCAGIVLGRAIIRDVYDREAAARAIAIVMMAMTLAPAVCPAIGAYLAQWYGWRAIFLLLGGLGALVLVLTWARLGETNPNPMPLDLAGMGKTYVLLLRSPGFAGFALCTACTSASWFTFTASAPYFLAEILHQPPSTYGLMILLPMAAYMLGNGIAARFSLRFGSNRVLVWGLILSCGAGLLMAVWCVQGSWLIWGLFVPIALASIGHGMSQPPAVAAGLSIYPRIAGAAAGLIGFLQMAMASVGTFAVAVLPRDAVLPTVTAVAGFMVLALLSGCWALRLTRPAMVAAAPAGG